MLPTPVGGIALFLFRNGHRVLFGASVDSLRRLALWYLV
jgi:hypothetical protein